MKNIFKNILCAGIFAVAPAAALAQATEAPPSGYTLRWSDEFNGTALDEKNWNIEVNGNGGGNQELQYYRRENVSVEDGNLVLTARRENYQGRSFTSGRITTQNKAAFKHGILQAKIKFPSTKDGLWPAYWMMGNDMNRYGWPKCGEMDIVELGHSNGIANGTQDRYFGGTLHYGANASNEAHQQFTQEYSAPEDNPITGNGYHIITVEWDDNNLYMYYDLQGYTAVKKRQARYFSKSIAAPDDPSDPNDAGNYFQKPYFFLFNLAVGGWYPSIFDPALITALPNADDEAKMYVDWVRVYQKDDDAAAEYLYTDASGNVQTNIPEEPEPPHFDDNKTQLSSFATQALDENGVSTFDFDDCEDVVLISTSQGVTGNFLSRSAVKADYNVDETNHFMWIWSETTYVPAGTADKKNSFGWDEGYSRFEVGSQGWSGLGFASQNGMQGKDLTMIDDSYWFHFAMKADDQDMHTSHTINVGDAAFRIGTSDGKLVSLGDFKRDGKWYYFDIPVKALRELAREPFGTTASNYYGNVVAFLSGGVTGAELDFDNIFFYKSKTKTIPSFTDESADLGKYGYKSLDENGKPVFDFSKAKNVTPLFLSGDVWEMLTANGTYDETSTIVKKEHDMSEQANKNNFFVWGDTFTGKDVLNTPNSFGNEPYGGFVSWSSVIGSGWNGAGWASIEGQGMNPTPKNLSHIDDTYSLHFSVRSDAAVAHAPFIVKLGSSGTDGGITLGAYSINPIFADFNRDGEWYSFDIPLKEFKKYGGVWSNAPEKGGIENYTDYVLAFNTGQTFYSGCGISIDNVFLFQPEEVPVVTDDLGQYTTKSLDADGKSYFDFSGKKYIPVTMGAAERTAAGSDNILDDFSIDDQKVHLYPWEGTLVPLKENLAETNSFGNAEEYIAWTVADKGWSGIGIINNEGYDVSQITDKFKLHFAVRGTQEQDIHLILGKAHFTIGHSGYVNDKNEVFPVLGDFKRDGEWYSYDIPMTEFWKINTNLWDGKASNFKDNLFVFEVGGKQGNELHIDNIFFWISDEDYEVTGIDTPSVSASQNNVVTGIFDIYGRKVQNMSKPGLYIIRTADRVKKVLVK